MARGVKALPLGVQSGPPQRSKGRWVIEALRGAIREGRLSPGSQLPSSRDLAKQWRVSRGIISAAYEELQSEGLIKAVSGSGTYVNPTVSDFTSIENKQNFTIAEFPSLFRLNPSQPFIAREADVSLFPIRIWRKLAQQAISKPKHEFFYEPNPAGHYQLRRQISRYLGFARGINCEPDDIIITTGTRHSLDLCLRALTQSGDKVWTESPGYAGAEALIGFLSLASVPVSIDSDGLQVETAEEIAPEAKLCIVTPSHQSPLGVRLSIERRQKLLSWAVRAKAFIFEDDYDGEFSFECVRFPALKAMDVEDRVIHAGSFNKILFPTLRIGYLVVPKILKAKILRVRGETGRNNGYLDQEIVSNFMSKGHFSQHIRQMERFYSHKCRTAIISIQNSFGNELDIIGNHGGFHFFIVLPDKINLEQFLEKRHESNIVVQVAPIRTNNGYLSGIVIGHSSLSLDVIRDMGDVLGKIMRFCSAGG